MTPERLELLAERLREFSPELSDERIARMLRDTLFVASGNGEGTLGVFSTLKAAKAAVQLLYNDRVDVSPLEWKEDDWRLADTTVVRHWHTADEDRFGYVDEVVIDRPFAFSPAETPAAASMPRPEATKCAYCVALALDGHNGMCRDCWERGWRDAEAEGS